MTGRKSGAGEKHLVSVDVGGRRLRVRSLEDPEDVRRIAAVVDRRIGEMAGGRSIGPELLTLVAMSFAAECEDARTRASHDRAMTRLRLSEVASRVEHVLACDEEETVAILPSSEDDGSEGP